MEKRCLGRSRLSSLGQDLSYSWPRKGGTVWEDRKPLKISQLACASVRSHRSADPSVGAAAPGFLPHYAMTALMPPAAPPELTGAGDFSWLSMLNCWSRKQRLWRLSCGRPSCLVSFPGLFSGHTRRIRDPLRYTTSSSTSGSYFRFIDLPFTLQYGMPRKMRTNFPQGRNSPCSRACCLLPLPLLGHGMSYVPLSRNGDVLVLQSAFLSFPFSS